MGERTEEGLPIVTEETFMEFLKEYNLALENNNPEVTRKIEQDNPQIYRFLKLGMEGAPDKNSRIYYECGVQIVYELLKRQESNIRRG